MNRGLIIPIFCLLLAVPLYAAGSETLKGLLSEVKQFSTADQAKNREREQAFDADLNRQQALLEESRVRLASAEQAQQRLKDAFDENDIKLGEIEALIEQRAGQLGEVFGVAKQTATELRSLLVDSLASAEVTDRSEQLAFAESKRVPTLADLEALWYQMQLEMTESGQISRFDAEIVSKDGTRKSVPVIRFGMFAAATERGEFLSWDAHQQVLTVLPAQPDNGMMTLAGYLQGSSDAMIVDPTRGQLFELLGRTPKLVERIHQGAEVGYVILALGALGLSVALYQMLVMMIREWRVKSQLRRGADIRSDNALGRVLLAASDDELTPEKRELRVDEAILKELPRLERGQSFVKLLATVAPLLGLLGTVVGMIATFQSITLFGTSDPKLMAGGISQALITTALGLTVAIPLLFSYSFLAARSRRQAQVLQEKSLGLLADGGYERTEDGGRAA
jgi:biopolymer transport protein ExbB